MIGKIESSRITERAFVGSNYSIVRTSQKDAMQGYPTQVIT